MSAAPLDTEPASRNANASGGAEASRDQQKSSEQKQTSTGLTDVKAPDNREFLGATHQSIIGGHTWVASFRLTPERATGLQWAGQRCELDQPPSLDPDANNYFCVALLSGARQKDHFERLACIVLDDPDVSALALPPSWVLETSPGKHQVGYILDDEMDTYDREHCERAINALVRRGLIKKDQSGNNVVRYVRLPIGSNTKARASGPFRHVMHEWQPQRSYRIADVLSAYGVALHSEVDRSSATLDANERLDYRRATELIVSGESIHDSSLRLVASLAHYGVPDGQVLGLIEGMIRASDADSDRVARRVADLPRMLSEAKRKFEKPDRDDNPDRFKFSLDRQVIEQPAMEWFVRGVLPKAVLAAIYAPSAAGKTFFALDLASSIALGRDYCGRKVRKSRVAWIVAEGAGGFRTRLLAYAKHNGGEFPGLLVCSDVPDLLGDRDHAAIAKQIEAAGGADLIVIDTLAASTAGANENSGEDMGRVLGHCRQLHELTGAMVLLVHHTGKDSTKGARGWSGLRAAVDVEIELSTLGEARTARLTKLKDGEDGLEFPFRLIPVEVGEDPDGNPISSCVVEHLFAPAASPRKPREPKGANNRLVYRTARELLPVDGCTVQVEHLINEASQRLVRDPEAPRDRRRQYVKQSLAALVEQGFISITGDTCTVH